MTTKGRRSDPILEALFTSRARVEVLKLLFLNTPKRRYLREIASLTHQAVRAVQRELARLEAAGLLVAVTEGNRKYYQVVRTSPVYPDLKALLIKTAGIGDLLRRHLRRQEGSIGVAFIFGSYARGTDTASSDLDLMVIGGITGRELARVLAPAREAMGREVNTVLMTPHEYRAKVLEGNPFVAATLTQPRIFLVGGEDDLRGLAEGRSAEAAPADPSGSPRPASAG